MAVHLRHPEHIGPARLHGGALGASEPVPVAAGLPAHRSPSASGAWAGIPAPSPGSCARDTSRTTAGSPPLRGTTRPAGPSSTSGSSVEPSSMASTPAGTSRARARRFAAFARAGCARRRDGACSARSGRALGKGEGSDVDTRPLHRDRLPPSHRGHPPARSATPASRPSRSPPHPTISTSPTTRP